MITAGLDTTKGPEYWIGRIGFGLMPMIQYNKLTQTRSKKDPMDVVAGPLVNDMARIATMFVTLAADPVARANWDVQIDDVLNDIIVVMNSASDNAETLNTLSQYMSEGAESFAESQITTAQALGRPASTTRRGEPILGGGGGGSTGLGDGLGGGLGGGLDGGL